jgi:hypothetical protein
MAECVRPFPDTPPHLELVFNLLSSFRDARLVPGWRPNGGFLMPVQRTAALESTGVGDVRFYPHSAAIGDAYPSFIVAPVVARRA